jgi:hypothetical protein
METRERKWLDEMDDETVRKAWACLYHAAGGKTAVTDPASCRVLLALGFVSNCIRVPGLDTLDDAERDRRLRAYGLKRDGHQAWVWNPSPRNATFETGSGLWLVFDPDGNLLGSCPSERDSLERLLVWCLAHHEVEIEALPLAGLGTAGEWVGRNVIQLQWPDHHSPVAAVITDGGWRLPAAVGDENKNHARGSETGDDGKRAAIAALRRLGAEVPASAEPRACSMAANVHHFAAGSRQCDCREVLRASEFAVLDSLPEQTITAEDLRYDTEQSGREAAGTPATAEKPKPQRAAKSAVGDGGAVAGGVPEHTCDAVCFTLPASCPKGAPETPDGPVLRQVGDPVRAAVFSETIRRRLGGRTPGDGGAGGGVTFAMLPTVKSVHGPVGCPSMITFTDGTRARWTGTEWQEVES